MREFEVEAEAPRRGIQHAQAFRHGFLADPVAGNDGDPVRPGGHPRCLQYS